MNEGVHHYKLVITTIIAGELTSVKQMFIILTLEKLMDGDGMISKSGVFCTVVELGSFTRAAERLGYSQSAVSQTIRNLEQELGSTLLDRRKDGIRLTADGEQYLPYLRAIYAAELALEQKHEEMSGLDNAVIRIGTFTSVSSRILPPLLKTFKDRYPSVTFVLREGKYTSIGKWIKDGYIDFGFVNTDAVSGVETRTLYEDEMMVLLPQWHPLAERDVISLRDLEREPFILMDEGDYSVAATAFQRAGVPMNVAYEVYDNFTILSLVRQGMGVSMIYENALVGDREGVVIRPVAERPKRTVALAWKNWDTLPYAARSFVEYILRQLKQ